MNRTIELEGCHNFRDLGGYPTRGGQRMRWRQVFRSDALHHLTPADVARLRDELHLGTVIDLRTPGERDADAGDLLGQPPLQFHHISLFDGESRRSTPPSWATLADLYFMMADFARGPIGLVISTLADTDTPAVYHCAAGKDRTGVISAILLGLLDVPDEVIVADYAATKENLDAIIERLLATEGYKDMFKHLPPDTMHAEPETMLGFLARLRERYGAFDAYAREAGVSDEAIGRLRARLIE
ncbi:MAG: tyrosine-protein phosphatase [bacterium]